MLQQTRVEAVKPYFERFLKELPDISALAVCPEDRLLKLWEGLGYYSRVRNMQKAARHLVEKAAEDTVLSRDDSASGTDVKIRMPRDPKELQALPGIGSYTAGAIASIAYGVRTPAVDGNVLRILARVTADDTDVLKASARREAEELLTKALQNKNAQDLDPGDFNQGLMDLGAGVCLPNSMPLCEKCPLADICEAHKTGRETAFPVRKKAKERRIEQRTILLVRDGEKVALTQRPETGLLAGMYEFPNLAGKQNKKAVLQAVERQNLEPLHIRSLEPARHLFSHIEWQMTGYEIRVAGFPETMNSERSPGESGGWFLVETGKVEREYPIPSAYKAYTRQLQIKLGARKENKHQQKQHSAKVDSFKGQLKR